MKLHYGTSGFIIAAGIIHIMIAPVHWQHAPAHGLFFAVTGAAQLIWGIAYWLKPTSALRNSGIIMTGALITLYIITRILLAPFGDEPGELEFSGVASKVMELAALISLAALSVSGEESRRVKISRWVDTGKIIVLSLLVGGLTYQLSILAEPIFPWLGEQSIHVAAVPAENPAKGNTYNPTPDDLQLVIAGFASPFSNGSEIPVFGDLLAELTVTPSDERYSRELAVYLYHQSSSEPVEDASIQVTARMRFMDHGTFDQIALNTGGGHYLLLLPFPMPDEWQLDLRIDTSDRQDTIRFDINIFD